MGINCRRPSDDPMTSSSPGLGETRAGRLSSRLSVWCRYSAGVHSEPLYEVMNSDHTVPMSVQKNGCGVRHASHRRPEESIFSRGMVLRGARCVSTGFDVVRLSPRFFQASG